jgi:hypothetical protein
VPSSRPARAPPFPGPLQPETNIGPAVMRPAFFRRCHHRLTGTWRPAAWLARSKPLVVVAVAGVLGATVSACSTSPPAASVNGQVITQTELSQNLQWWASSPAYVAAFDQASKAQSEQYASQGETVPAFSVVGAGSGPDNYGLPWTTGRLTLLVSALAVHQYVAHRGESPSYLERSAAWATEEASIPQVWAQLPPQLRSSVADEGAELALVQLKAPNLSSAEQFYKANLSSFWSQVCLTSIDVSVPGPGGTIDMAASHKQAEAVAAELTAASAGGPVPTVGTGARYCLSPEQLIVQPAVFRQAVYALAPGKAGLVPQSWGYEVVQVRSRTLIPFNAQVASVIGVVALGAGPTAYTWPVQGDANDSGLTRILKAADVKVDPAFGSWTTALPSPPYIPQVWPAGQANP